MAEQTYNLGGLALCFDDILMSPRYTTIKSRKDVDLSINIGTNGRRLFLKVPLMSSPMDTITESSMAIGLALNGGIGVIHRFLSIEDQIAEVSKVKRFLQYIISSPYGIPWESTLNDISRIKKNTGVSTFCVFNNSGQFAGLLTNRDTQYINKSDTTTILAKNIMTPLNKLHIIPMKAQIFKDLISCNRRDEIDTVITRAKEIMIATKVEKIPIIDEETTEILGLITWKTVQHYEDNSTIATLDEMGKLRCGAAIGLNEWDRLEKLLAASVDLICLDTANAYNEQVITFIREVRTRYPMLVFMVGCICTGEAFLEIAKCDVDQIRVNIGASSICSTRLVSGIGVPQFSAINDCYDMKKKHGLETHIISDGGHSGLVKNMCIALASGASVVFLGKFFAGTYETPGQIFIKDGKKVKLFRGMASLTSNISKQQRCAGTDKVEIKSFAVEGVEGFVEVKGHVKDLIQQIIDGMRSSLSYLGCHSLDELHTLRRDNAIKFNIITSLGYKETGIRIDKF